MNKNTLEKPVKQEAAEVQTPVAVRKEETKKTYPFHLLQRDMNRLFDDFAHGLNWSKPRFAEPFFAEFQVKVDFKDNDKHMVVSAEIPGVSENELDITVDQQYLTISGEKKEEKEEKENGFYASERRYGAFKRVIPLPCEVEMEGVEATFKNGVLKIVLPKSKEALKSARKVEIKPEK